jgi:cell wall-associated NlpC family hydrolase
MPKTLRSLAIAVIALAAALAVVLAPVTGVRAAPSASDVQKQIDTLWNQLEPLVEQYNGVHVQLQTNLAKQQQLETQLKPLRTQIDLAQTKVGAMSAQLYKSGPGSKVAMLLGAGSPEGFVDELTALNHLAKTQAETISVVAAQFAQYNKEKAPLDVLVAQQQKQDADLSAKKTQISGQMSSLQKLLDSIGGGAGSGALAPVACPQTYIGGAAGKAITKACSLIGHPYGWGDAGPTSYDCSGLTMVAWAAGGVSLAHFTGAQWSETTRVSKADLRPGDLVFYGGDIHHVAIYVGNGWVVHAPHTGDKVRMAKMEQIGSIHGYGRPG